MISYIVALAFTGLIVGALGRLAIPGPNPMSIPMTILVGVGGAFIGGLVGTILFNRGGGLLLAVAGAALIVWLMERSREQVGALTEWIAAAAFAGWQARGEGVTYEVTGPSAT